MPVLIGASVLWGVAGTVGLLARAALLFPTELVLAAPLFVIVLASETLLVAALWEALRQAGRDTPAATSRTPRARPFVSWVTLIRLSLATVILAVPAIAWGLHPQQLAVLAGFPANTNELALWQAAVTARRSIWVGLVVSGIGGVGLGLLRQQIFGRMRGWQRGDCTDRQPGMALPGYYGRVAARGGWAALLCHLGRGRRLSRLVSAGRVDPMGVVARMML